MTVCGVGAVCCAVDGGRLGLHVCDADSNGGSEVLATQMLCGERGVQCAGHTLLLLRHSRLRTLCSALYVSVCPQCAGVSKSQAFGKGSRSGLGIEAAQAYAIAR
jgi:hypothetical protein